tara:strand:- start:539 stop:922 length:384 start_codon:yes stop_codon:yes gene_type:complete
MEVGKDSLAWKVGDALIPDPYKTKLYTNWFTSELAPDTRVELNYWSWMHFLSGLFVALAFPQATFLIWMIIHFIWELYQISIGMSDIVSEPKSEIIDITFDTIFAASGWYTGRVILNALLAKNDLNS